MPLSARQTCGVNILARLSWGYLAKMAEGRAFDAAPYLDVLRATYLAERATLASELPAGMPTTLDTLFDSRMRLVIQVSLVIALSGAGVTGAASMLSSLPQNASQIGPWFRDLQGRLPESIQERLRDYLEIPSSGDFVRTLASVVASDRRCQPTAPPPPVQDPPPPAPPPPTDPARPTRNSPVTSSGGSTGNAGGGMLVALGLAAVVAWGYYRTR